VNSEEKPSAGGKGGPTRSKGKERGRRARLVQTLIRKGRAIGNVGVALNHLEFYKKKIREVEKEEDAWRK